MIGAGNGLPWMAKGEQLLFQAMTYNAWLLMGRKTFESMGVLPDKKHAVLSRSKWKPKTDNVIWFPSIEEAMTALGEMTNHVFIAGGGQIYEAIIDRVDIIHLSIIHAVVSGDVFFPAMPEGFAKVFEQAFKSNIDYTYQIWKRGT